jgi:cyclomaltodextrinase / maltogenic alpha-amylase / neopullulanase
MNRHNLFLAILLGVFTITTVSCKQQSKPTESTEVKTVDHPDWSTDASIYEVNIRQFTEEGTFEALEGHLPRIKELGTEIIWLMPIHPIGELNRKGGLGSYYSVKDYKGINPEFGDSLTFKRFIQRAHNEGLYVIIDWVANHSSWDNPLVTQKPEWYAKDSTGNMFAPFDWTDVVKFDFAVPELRTYMIGAMKYWVEEYDIDGFRCDVAGEVPMDFWNDARTELDKIKPVFMLAEAEGPQFHSAFDMTYGWEFHHIMNKVYKGEAGPDDIEDYLLKNDSLYPEDAYRMYFITNHDENSWNGTEFERLGGAVETFFALTTLVPGMPLVYSGQETALDKRLEFFEKDPIDWGNYEMTDFYKTILGLNSAHPALYNGEEGGEWSRITTDNDDKAFVILTEKNTQKVLGLFNLSPVDVTIALTDDKAYEMYKTLFTFEDITVNENTRFILPAWSYKVLYK